MERVKTGVEGIDVMLRGGLFPARPYVLSGPTGSGKTILAMHFLLEGLKHNEPCLLVTVDEPPSEVKANMGQFGFNLDHLKILDATPDVRAHRRSRSVIDVGTALEVRDMENVGDIRQSTQIRAIEVTVHSVQKMIKQEFAQHLERTKVRYKRIVVDSMTALKMFSMQGEDSRILIQSFMRFLAELEATTIVVSEHLDWATIETEFFLSRGEIRFHKWLDGTQMRRAVSVEKFRGSAFDDNLRPVVISNAGMAVYPETPVTIPNGSRAKSGESLLEVRIIDEISTLMEASLRKIEEAQRRQIQVRDLEVALSRAMLHFQRKNYQKALKQALACQSQLEQRLGEVPPPTASPVPPPPKEVKA